MKMFKTALALALSAVLLLQIVPLQASASSTTVQASSTISDTLYTPDKVASELEYTYADRTDYLTEIKQYTPELGRHSIKYTYGKNGNITREKFALFVNGETAV